MTNMFYKMLSHNDTWYFLFNFSDPKTFNCRSTPIQSANCFKWWSWRFGLHQGSTTRNTITVFLCMLFLNVLLLSISTVLWSWNEWCMWLFSLLCKRSVALQLKVLLCWVEMVKVLLVLMLSFSVMISTSLVM